MAARANWKGVLKIGEVACPVALYTAASRAERIAFHILNRKTGHRVHIVSYNRAWHQCTSQLTARAAAGERLCELLGGVRPRLGSKPSSAITASGPLGLQFYLKNGGIVKLGNGKPCFDAHDATLRSTVR
jgi:hypothetical protein